MYKTLHTANNNLHCSYSMENVVLEDVKSEGDLGVLSDSELTFRQHISASTQKANQMLGLIKRALLILNLKYFCLCIRRWLVLIWNTVVSLGALGSSLMTGELRLCNVERQDCSQVSMPYLTAKGLNGSISTLYITWGKEGTWSRFSRYFTV